MFHNLGQVLFQCSNSIDTLCQISFYSRDILNKHWTTVLEYPHFSVLYKRTHECMAVLRPGEKVH